MVNLSKILLGILILSGCILTSCVKDNFDMDKWNGDVEYNGSFALPAAFSEVTMAQVLGAVNAENANVDENDEGYLSIFYSTTVESKPVQDLLQVGDQHISQSINMADVIAQGRINRATNVITYTKYATFPFSMFNTDAEIDSLVLSAGDFTYDINTTFGRTTKLVIEFPSITKNSRPYKDSVTFTILDVSSTKTVSLAGYHVDLTQTAQHYNEVPVKLTVQMTYDTADPPLSGQIGMDFGLNGFNYSVMHGYFGYNELFFQRDTIQITLFKPNPNMNFEKLYFCNPKLSVHYWNSYGVPSMFFFTNLSAHFQDGSEADVTSSSPDFPMSSINPYTVAHATSFGTEALDSVAINKSNSNLDYVVSNRPRWLSFSAKAATNPNGQTHHNFIGENSLIRSKVDIEFPMWGYLRDFNYNDTIDFDLEDLLPEVPLSRVAVVINIDNGLPAETFFQAYFVDQNYHIIDSAICNNSGKQLVIESATIDSNGKLTGRATKQTRVEVTKERLNRMMGTKYVVLAVEANTTDANNNKPIKIFKEYGIKVNVGVEFDVDFQGDVDSLLNAIGVNGENVE